MISLVFAVVLAAGTTGAAPPSAPAAAASEKAGERRVCHKISYLGSRLNSQTICKSKREWDQIQWEHDKEVRDGQEKNRTLQHTGP